MFYVADIRHLGLRLQQKHVLQKHTSVIFARQEKHWSEKYCHELLWWNRRMYINDYLTWPVVTTIRVSDAQQSLPFPGVTICSMNPVDCTRLAFVYIENQQELNDLMFYSQCYLSLTVNPLRSKLVHEITWMNSAIYSLFNTNTYTWRFCGPHRHQFEAKTVKEWLMQLTSDKTRQPGL